MSQTNDVDDRIDADEAAQKFKGHAGVSSPDVDIPTGDDHALDKLENVEHEREYDPTVTGQRFVELYESRDRFLREFLNNAETACYVRAILELVDHDPDTYSRDELDGADWTVRNVIEEAKDVTGYSPSIYVRRSRSNDDHALRIEDNGCGMSVEEYLASKDVGSTGWKGIASSNGMFGMGKMSGFLGCGIHSKFGTITHDYETGDSWSVEERVDKNIEAPWTRDTPGTTFFWPSFAQETIDDVDVADAVEEYQAGLRVPVVYEEYDENGERVGSECEEYGPFQLEDRLPDDATYVVYESEFERAVWSPEISTAYSADYKPITLNVAQPTDRNDGQFSTSHDSFEMPGPWDLRVKREAPDGFVRHVPDDIELPDEYTRDELIGMKPISDGKYENQIPVDEKDEYIPMSELPSSVITTPAVTGDRDRFKDSDSVRDYCEFVSERLKEEYADQVADVFEQVEEIHDIFELDQNEMNSFLRGFREFSPDYASSSAQNMADHFEEELDVDMSEDLCKKLDCIDNTVSLAPRNKSGVARERYRSDTKVRKVLQKAGQDGDVYMATRVYEPKAEIVWELHENNQVVQMSSRKQQKYKDRFGWKSLHGIPTSDVAESFPNHDFDDDFLDRVENSSSSSSNSGLDTGDGDFDDERAKQRDVRVRLGAGNPTNMSTYSGGTLYDRFDNGKQVSIGSSQFDTLVLYDDRNNRKGVGQHIASTQYDVAYAVVPKYVYDYLIGADNVYTESGYRDMLAREYVEFDWHESDSDGTTFSDLDESNVVAAIGTSAQDTLEAEGLTDQVVTTIDNEVEFDVESVTFVDGFNEFEEQFDRGVAGSPSLVTVGRNAYGHTLEANIDVEPIYYDAKLGDLDWRNATEWSDVKPDFGETEQIERLQTLADAGGFASTDDSVSPPSQDALDLVPNHIQPSDESYYMTKTIERLSDELDWSDDK